jgi:hypothetical protein
VSKRTPRRLRRRLREKRYKRSQGKPTGPWRRLARWLPELPGVQEPLQPDRPGLGQAVRLRQGRGRRVVNCRVAAKKRALRSLRSALRRPTLSGLLLTKPILPRSRRVSLWRSKGKQRA